MKIKDLLNRVEGKIYARGEDYYKNDYISFLTYDPQKHSYYGEVKGSGYEDYKINIGLDENKDVAYYDCNCPYDWSDTCKHLIAIFLAIENGEYVESSQKHAKSVKNIEKIKNEMGDIEEDIFNLIDKASKKI